MGYPKKHQRVLSNGFVFLCLSSAWLFAACGQSNTDSTSTEAAVQGASVALVKAKTETGSTENNSRVAAPDSINYLSYGASVAVSGNLIAVCAPDSQVDGVAKAGAVTVLSRSGVSIAPVVSITPAIPQQNMHFGESCAFRNGRLAFTSPQENKVYQFDCGEMSCSIGAIFSVHGLGRYAVDGKPLGGPNVALSDSHVVIGAPSESLVYVSPKDSWIPQVWQVEDANHQKMMVNYGASVAIDDNFFVAGAPDFPRTKASVTDYIPAGGAAYLFENSNDTWENRGEVPVGTVLGASFDGHERFGSAVAINSHSFGTNVLAVIGAPTADSTVVSNGNVVSRATNSGRLYANTYSASGHNFVSHGEVFQTVRDNSDLSNADWQYLGASVAIEGQNVVVGRPGSAEHNRAGQSDFFKVGVGSEGSIGDGVRRALLRTEPQSASAYFGQSISLSAQNFAIVGAPGVGATIFAGAAYMFDLDDRPDSNVVFGPDASLPPFEDHSTKIWFPIVLK